MEDAWLLLDKFFHEFIPSFEIANKLWLNVDVKALAKDLEGVVAFSPEGSSLLLPKGKLTDNETLILWLVAGYVGYKLGKLAERCAFQGGVAGEAGEKRQNHEHTLG